LIVLLDLLEQNIWVLEEGMGRTSAGIINFPPLALWKETIDVPGLEISLPAPP